MRKCAPLLRLDHIGGGVAVVVVLVWLSAVVEKVGWRETSKLEERDGGLRRELTIGARRIARIEDAWT